MFFWINEYYEILNEEKVFFLGNKKTNVLNKLKKMFENYQNKEKSKQL